MIAPGSLQPILGPMRCQDCGRFVIFGVATFVFVDSWDSRVLRRGTYDAVSQQIHRCQGQEARAAA